MQVWYFEPLYFQFARQSALEQDTGPQFLNDAVKESCMGIYSILLILEVSVFYELLFAGTSLTSSIQSSNMIVKRLLISLLN